MASRFSSAHPHELDQSTEQLMWLIHGNLPDPPASTTARLRTLRAAPSDGVDRISCLPDALIRDIVSRLPAKDAARTAVLAARWRGVWRSTPLVLVDTHLLPNRAPSRNDVTAAVSRLLAAHPGPFRCVHLTRGRMGAHPAHLRLWLRLLAARGVQELVLVNRPSPIDVRLPSTLFTISTLTRLYIGVWKFPDAAGLQGASFPHLRELGICSVAVESGDIDAVVARSPALEILNIQGTMMGVRLRLVSHSLRCVQICAFVLESVEVVNAPRLERLVLSECLSPAGGSSTRVKIGNVPKLSLFGYLEPGKYALEIQDTVIMAGIKTSASMIITSVKTLSLRVRFGVHDDIKMVPAFLKCFPNVETLHITSEKCGHTTANLNLKSFWEEVGLIVSVRLRIQVMTYREYRAEQDELAFLQYIFQNALALKYVLVQMANPRFTSRSLDEMSSMYNMNDKKWVSKFLFVLGGTHGPGGGEPWNFKKGANFSNDDPMAPMKFILKDAGPKTHQPKPQAGWQCF